MEVDILEKITYSCWNVFLRQTFKATHFYVANTKIRSIGYTHVRVVGLTHKRPVGVLLLPLPNIKNGSQILCSISLIRRSRIEVPRVDYDRLSGDRMGSQVNRFRHAFNLHGIFSKSD